jgi:hypothetical protein
MFTVNTRRDGPNGKNVFRISSGMKQRTRKKLNTKERLT